MYALLMLVAGIATFALATYAWLRGAKPTVRGFALLLAAIALWLTCISGWSLAPSLAIAQVWFWLQFLGVSAVPVLLFSYVLHFTGRGRALTIARQLLLWAIPLITQIAAWSNPLHQLMFRQVSFVRRGGLFILESWLPGPWFLIHSAYSFSLAGVAMILMARAIVGSPNVFRRQLAALLIALVPAFLLTLLNTLQLIPADLWITPMAFVLTGAAIVWAIVRDQMVALVPVARDMLIEQMDDAMLVIDEGERIVDLNPVMESLLGRSRGELLSQPAARALATIPGLLESARAADATPIELELSPAGTPRHYEAIARTLRQGSITAGRLLVLRDITRMKLAQAELFLLATTDGLTGLNNRRQFFQLARPQVEIAARNGRPLALLLFDLDHFKQVNDRHGHEAGDQVLRTVAERARSVTRGGDILCRYGGEEFAILLVEAGPREAGAVAERLRAAVAAQPVMSAGLAIAVTASIGMAVSQPAAARDLDELLRLADGAMYRAKQAGRNRVECADK